jgi:hypothetical protein
MAIAAAGGGLVNLCGSVCQGGDRQERTACEQIQSKPERSAGRTRDGVGWHGSSVTPVGKKTDSTGLPVRGVTGVLMVLAGVV